LVVCRKSYEKCSKFISLHNKLRIMNIMAVIFEFDTSIFSFS